MGSVESGEPGLADLLYKAALSSHGLAVFDETADPTYLSYQDLLGIAIAKSRQILALRGTAAGTVVFLHFSTFLENVEWFWAVIIAGLLPAISTPLPTDVGRRQVHLRHVYKMLQQPIILTSERLAGDFEGLSDLQLTFVEKLGDESAAGASRLINHETHRNTHAVLMLTSGSSGNAKAVILNHELILKAIQGKRKFFETTNMDRFLNWIGFDHVASMIETHMHAMHLCAAFVHVPAPILLEDPLLFLRLIDQYRITYTFAPNFFLAMLLQRLRNSRNELPRLDLSCLRYLISGGESNLIETATELTKALKTHNIQREVVTPGFGMTETCAGCVYSKSCPSYDVGKGNSFASLGKPIPGLRMRIAYANSSRSKGEVGDLQLSGDQVFGQYFNNSEASASCRTEDGWFITGDRAFIDLGNNLNIVGREKESINLNGVKYSPNVVESALDNAEIPGLTPSWTVVFSCRPSGSAVEEICVVYLPTFDLNDVARRVDTDRVIVNVVGSVLFTRTKHIIPLPSELLHKSALGKLSRAKIKASFTNGEFENYEDGKSIAVCQMRAQRREAPSSETERVVMNALLDVLDIPDELGVNDSLFDFGLTSTGLFALKKRVEKDLALPTKIPIGTLLASPTVSGIAGELDHMHQDGETEYNPVVPLQTNSNSAKPPLWLVHPGSGDVLVFVELAKYFPERTVFGLRTKGLNTGLEEAAYFTSIEDIANTYLRHIKDHQPNGPYAIAGYSLGSTVAFEIAKRLETTHNDVKFLGLLDSPPHMRELIEKLDWIDVLSNVAYFLDLISENISEALLPTLRQGSCDEALEKIIASAPKDRLETLAIEKTRLHKMTDVTNTFRLAGQKYSPKGSVKTADVFWVTPLLSVAPDRAHWMDNHLSRWEDFVSESLKFHECDGTHSKMLNSEYVKSFQKSMRAAMSSRGI